ncbi:class D sortase [Robertmurraya kyonggiensis]|uniref:Class D sortase n=1 Tax=Robertmurraya kyonggiensis TaxID=1037680 RepID=A0A4U1D4C2_9BACI|nr:class D sortase [Robertmurraya kyonggiensis]
MKSGYLIMFIGLCLIGYASWGIIQSNVKTGQTLVEAKKVIAASHSDSLKDKFSPKQGDTVGLLKIPAIESELAIVEGTDPEELEKGVGHYKGSYFPDQNGQIVLSGHRDTVFKQLGKLKLGDELQVEISYGEYSYKIVDTKIVDADDTSIITLQNEKEELILTTCYPFGYIGNAPQRYIIYAEKQI